ncbi:tryptophan--tRNA ligase [Microgenomates bacterium UTCPR1]|nr:MAG: tryptophan--tRNA ligase [Microgenomates bacterium UTCPR1]
MINRVLAGIRATGRLHLGNYLGAIKGMIELQNNSEYETLYMVADTHAITTPYNVEGLKTGRREVFIDYLSAGLDPEKSILFLQSDIGEQVEIAFYLSSVVSIARMQHLPTYKDKVTQYPNSNTMALLNYPILMAADILAYKASLVPVGVDQEPHLEVAREIARKMNQTYGMDFPEPKRFATQGEYIPSLTGEGKMSKTVSGSYINLTDSKEEIQKKVRSIPTATEAGGEITGGLKTLFMLGRIFIPDETIRFKEDFMNGTLRFVDFKDALSEAIAKDLEPFQEKRAQISRDTEYVDRVIKEGAEKARVIVKKTLHELKSKMGLT